MKTHFVTSSVLVWGSGLTRRWSGRVKDKVPSSNVGMRAAQPNRYAAMNGIPRLVICGTLFLCKAISAVAAVDHLPADVRTALEQKESFKPFSSVSVIPESARASFARATRDKSFAMAEPGAKWQVTDVILEPNLPWRRLQAGVASTNFLVVFYEHGRRGHSYHVCVFRLSAGDSQLAWHAIRAKEVLNLDDLNVAIRSGTADDDPRNLL